MCIPANVARYYCDYCADDHRYQPHQRWNRCHNHENPKLRNQRFLETPQRRLCCNSLNPHLPTDICPDDRAEFGDADGNIIQKNIRVLFERLREASNGRGLGTGAPDIREHAYLDGLYYSDCLDPNPGRKERFAEYGDHPQHPRPPRNWGNRTRVYNYWRVLQDLKLVTIRNEINAEEGNQARPEVMRRLLFQLYRARIEYQRAWAALNVPLAPDI